MAAEGAPPSGGPRRVAVDLTPVLPGGENGGAKGFSLALVRALARLHPESRFILLTQAASHAELAGVDAPNVERRLVIGPAASRTRRGLASAVLGVGRRLPAPARQALALAAYHGHQWMKRATAPRTLGAMDADLLYCPFTAPTFHEPGIATACTVYDLQHRVYPRFFAPEDVVHRERVVREACAKAQAVATISRFTRDALVAARLVDAARVQAIPLQVERPAQATDAAIVAALGLEPGRYLLYPANFWKHKNHEMLLAAFAVAARSPGMEGMRLACTGHGPARGAWLAEAARRLAIGDRVCFPGFVRDDQLAALMQHARALVFPSLYEGFGLPVVEAMARGLPVACGNVAALPEVAGDAALLFDPRRPHDLADAIVRIATDDALRARLVEAGRRRAVDFLDVDAMARSYWTLFVTACARVPR